MLRRHRDRCPPQLPLRPPAAMLKRISVHRLTPGMYLHELCGSWMDHPFWSRSFLVRDADEVRRIVETGIAEAWIDTDKGLDADEPAVQTPGNVEQALTFAATAPLPLIDLPDTAPDAYVASGSPGRPVPPSPLQVREQARRAMSQLFGEARLGKAVDVARCEPVVDEIMTAVARNTGAMLNVVRLKRRDEYTYMHSVAVCTLMIALGRTLGFGERQCREAGLAGLLHDIGKALVPLDILVKPARLTDEEFRVIRGHAAAGHALLRGSRLANAMALDVCLNHHEKIDGSGYPRRLPAAEISLFAKMGAVCDVYDAVTSDRPYKRGWDPGEAIREMAQWQGHFDPMVFQAFVKTVGIYPVGSLVRLRSQRLALVVEQHPQALLTPTVQPVYALDGGRYLNDAPPLDLRRADAGDAIAGAERPAEWAERGVVFAAPAPGAA
jgi:HD-GYP domain-containing protein (c-di-GMP phosphodiesterase class II)